MSIRTASPATQTSPSGPSSTTAIPHEKIATRAYEKWCKRGCMQGTHQQDWLEAETELKAEMMGGKGMHQTMPQATAARGAQPMPAAMPQKSASRK
jgi:Protein of unknown function (DUF2934)